MKYFIGIDSGSQSTKVAILDQLGREIVYSTSSLREYHCPAPGLAVHPDDDIWHSIKQALTACVAEFKGNKQDIIGIGLCTIRCCRALLQQDGHLAQPVISWMDSRMATHYEHVDPKVAFVTTTTGYVSFKLTGEFTDAAANCEFGWPIDHGTLDWSTDDGVIAAHGLRREMLFTLKKPSETLGLLRPELAHEFGLATIPVVASANDKAVEALGCGMNHPDTLMISLGTYINSMLLRDHFHHDAASFYPTLACVPFKYLYESVGIRRGMWTVSWFKKLIGEGLTLEAQRHGLSEEQYCNQQCAHIAPGSDGLITILDWLAPPTEPFRKGIMLGFDHRHTRFHIYRSILEAIAFTIYNNASNMTTELGLTPREIVVIGGGSHSNVLMQVIADVFNLPVIRKEGSSCGCVGTAICAAINLRIYPSYDAAIEQMVRTTEVFTPHSEHHQIYQQINNEVFRQAHAHTDGLLKNSYHIYH